MQNKNPFEIILYVGRVTSLQSWVTKKSCHGQTLINKCSIFNYPSNFEFIQLFGRLYKINGGMPANGVDYVYILFDTSRVYKK